ncbi:MAG: NADH:flavin oxidoreductase/NADH oxidase family protein, partial [Polyangiaceae bacterium]|nr:NADH:flavin oxidoreductase/NADH oxidase family protein [Polyangiaceae bacterium]
SEALGTIDNRPTEALVRLYDRWARGGTGLLVTGNVMIDRRALGEPNNVALEDDRDLPMLKRWAEAGKQDGTHIWVQLNHPGKQVPKGLNREAVAPSAVPFAPHLAPLFAVPRALTVAEISDVVQRFGKSAALAKEAGFTGVQIHGAHGYLVSQFLSPHHNQRDDAYGGSLDNRFRFLSEVYQSIREAVGPSFPIGIKMNSADFQKGGFTEEEARVVMLRLSELGIDLIELSGGTYEAPVMAQGAPAKESTKKREAYFLELAERARADVSVPLAVTGGFRTRQGIEDALAAGALDVVGLGRSVALDPDLPKKILAGEEAVSAVRPLRTGIAPVDRAGFMEVGWYTRQIHRIGRGLEPRPNENALLAFLAILCSQGLRTLRTRLRA